jgi:agmatine/peptidylarginine deiminase
VVTIVSSSNQQTYVEGQYASHGVNTSNCSYLIAGSDSYWTRDYGPWFIIDQYGDQGIVDTVYNRPRPNDDKIPTKLGQAHGIPVYAMDLITAGGNYMSDGQGNGCSTDLTWSENPGKTKNQIRQMAEDYLGVTNYHVIPDCLGAYIKHIDCTAKWLAPDKVMVIEVAPSHSQYTEIEAQAAYFASQTSGYGTPYKVYRVYTPNGQPYVNSLILSGKILVPTVGSSWDDDAIQSYQDALPGFEVLGFSGSWVTTDALHCRTMGITDSEMLYLSHTPLEGNVVTGPSGFFVEADVIPYSGQALINGTPKVHWKTTGGWNDIAMTHVTGDTYEAFIPTQPDGTEIQYYINAQDASGRDENHPYAGGAGPHSFFSYDPILGADVLEIPWRFGATVNFSLNAGAGNAYRDYILLAGASGTSPGFPLPGGLETLPLNWDAVTDVVMILLNTPVCMDFLGQLDNEGRASAQLNLGPLPSGSSGSILHFAYALNNPWDFTSDALAIDIVD